MSRLDLNAACLAAAALLLLGSALPGAARPVETLPGVARDAALVTSSVAAPTTTSRQPAAPEGSACAAVRRKLWTESDGWIVRKVAVCR